MPLTLETQPEIRANRTFRSQRALRLGLGVIGVLLGCLRFLNLNADFPNFSPWALDQAKYTDEGWWASAAIRHQLFGYWNLPGDYNPAVAVPVWPVSLDVLFRFTGVSLTAARAFSVGLSVATLAIVYLLIRRCQRGETHWAPGIAVILLASSPFAFVYSRLAILDTFVVFQFCLMMLLASYMSERRLAVLAALAALIPILVLTKTTALALLPAVAWIAWAAMKTDTMKARLGAMCFVILAAAVAVRTYIAWVFSSGHELDYRDFFDSNSLDPIDWTHTLATLGDIVVSCLWTGRILFPLAVALGFVALVWLRECWKNPLFVACWLAIGGQIAFLFAAQGSYAPRYFLAMLVPLATIVALILDRLRERGSRGVYLAALASVAAVTLINISTLGALLLHPTFQFYDAAVSIGNIVRNDPHSNPLVLGVSGAELSLVTGLPFVSDVYGTVPLSQKISTYRPGWYLAWNRIGPSEREALGNYRLVEVANYPAFDDDERNRLILFRLDLISRR